MDTRSQAKKETQVVETHDAVKLHNHQSHVLDAQFKGLFVTPSVTRTGSQKVDQKDVVERENVLTTVSETARDKTLLGRFKTWMKR